MKRFILIYQCFVMLFLYTGCGLRDGFQTAEYVGPLLRAPQGGLNVTYPFEIQSKNAKHITDFPSIFYVNSLDSLQQANVIDWDHWLNSDEKCVATIYSNDDYEVDCGDSIGVLTVFMTYADSEGESHTLIVTVDRTSEANQSESDVFPDGRD